MRTSKAAARLLLVLLLSASCVWSFQYGRWGSPGEYPAGPPATEYSFARIVYRGFEDYGYRRYSSWATDYPKADIQFLMGVKRLSRIDSTRGPATLHWDDKRLFQYPILYAVEVGYMYLSNEDAAHLREYIARGGFFIVDDFHGTFEWERFEHEIRKVFPDRPIVEVDIADPIFHCLFDVKEKIQVPGAQYIRSGVTYEKGGVTPHYRGIYDNKGRLVVMINYNVDLGDAWEWADIPEYPEKFADVAYRLGINYIVYAMTH